ncbi:MAG: M57 family metalloprotease [Cyclobacteriaceae bacterium]
MKYLYTAFTAALLLPAFLISSCSDHTAEEVSIETTQATIPVEAMEKFQNAGFCTGEIARRGEDYLLEGDIVVTPEALAEMESPVSITGPAGEEQYRACNLLFCYRQVVRVIKVKSSGLNRILSTGLDWALANYNSLNLSLEFQRVSEGPADITVYATSGNGGLSGFPSSGNPYPSVYIGTGVAAYGTNVAEHVIGHEVGHAIGMRHTDYFDRSLSCGSGGDEGGCAVHIPGTTTYYDEYSQFKACFTTSETGEFSYHDIIALKLSIKYTGVR